MSKFIELKDLDYTRPFQGLKAKMVHSESQTFAFWEIEAGAMVPEHQHIHEQVAIVTKGELELTVDGESRIMTPGMVALIPSNTNHAARAITAVEVTDVFLPVRADYKS